MPQIHLIHIGHIIMISHLLLNATASAGTRINLFSLFHVDIESRLPLTCGLWNESFAIQSPAMSALVLA
jgi:hypothetical protein